MVSVMLRIKPDSRPDCSQIIRKIEKINKVPSKKMSPDGKETSDHNLLGTIEIPKDLRQLEDVLPSAQYDLSSESRGL